MGLLRFHLATLFCTLFAMLSHSQGLPAAEPAAMGFSEERLARADALLSGLVDSGERAGVSAAVVRNGHVVYFKQFGMANIAAGAPMEADTIFRIYSMSKPITSAAVMMLFEEGRFLLDDPVSNFLPEFKDAKVFKSGDPDYYLVEDAKREITIRHLLTHTAGLSYGFDPDDAIDTLYQRRIWDVIGEIDLAEASLRAAGIPLKFHPGEKWHYSFSVDVQGRLVEAVSGMPFETFLEERIFKPLGMTDTGFFVPEAKHGRLAELYTAGDDGGLDIEESGRDYTKPPSMPSGGGGLVSTAGDYLRFCQMLLNGGELDGVRVLGRKTIEMMTVNHLPETVLEENGGRGFGLGFDIRMSISQKPFLGSKGEYGWAGAASTVFSINPEEKTIVLFLTQHMPFGDHAAKQFQTLAYQALTD